MQYPPSQREQPFFERLPADEIMTGSHAEGYDIAGKDSKYVGWFGIVRKIEEDVDADQTTLTIEHKYFDGWTDSHILAVSFNGSGDFQAILKGTGHRIPPLSLVKVYGTVTKGQEDAMPRIDAVFMRNWHWGTFTFLAAYGPQRGSEQWRKANQVSLDDIYDPWPHPCHHYYEKRLGKRSDGPEIRKRLLDAAGPLSPEARQAMERLADLLALGHTWDKAETLRQAGELSEICRLAKETDCQKAAIALLLQALHENDERVSWSATDKFATFDPAGEAIEPLVELLRHDLLRVRAGAALALASGYGSKAAPAVPVLSKWLGEANAELKAHAIRALNDIGPSAKEAVPALRNVLADEDLGIRLNAAEALWCITRQPEEVIPTLIGILGDRDESERCGAAGLLEEIGPVAASAVPVLTKMLKDEDWCNRCQAARALGAIGPKAAVAIPALTKMLQEDEDSFAKANAAEALGDIGDPKAVPVLIAALKDEDDSVRRNAISALETLGPRAKAAVPALIRAVEDDEANAWIAVITLGTIDTEGVSTPTLIEALESENDLLRRCAAYGLGRMGRKAETAETALRNALADPDEGVRTAVAAAFWSVTGETEEPVRVLRSVLQTSNDWRAHMWAADTLAEIGLPAKSAVPELAELLKSKVPFVVTSSCEALGKIGPDAASAIPALTACLEDSDDPRVQVDIARVLWQVGCPEKARPVLKDALEHPTSDYALSDAVEAVGKIGPQAKELLPLLQPLLHQDDPLLRELASKAIERIEK